MKKENRIKDLQRTYDLLTDPDKQEEARRKHQIKKSLEDKKKDSGIL